MNRATRRSLACTLHRQPVRAQARQFCIDAQAAPKLTEDPPFGGLWCDQPAIFLPARFHWQGPLLDVPAGEALTEEGCET